VLIGAYPKTIVAQQPASALVNSSLFSTRHDQGISGVSLASIQVFLLFSVGLFLP
jgi:hypothetical protein